MSAAADIRRKAPAVPRPNPRHGGTDAGQATVERDVGETKDASPLAETRSGSGARVGTEVAEPNAKAVNGVAARTSAETRRGTASDPVPWTRTVTTPRAAASPLIAVAPLLPDAGDEARQGATPVPGGTADPAPAAGPPGRPPYQLVRMLTALQDDIARGSGAALRAQRVLAGRIEENFRRTPPGQWADLRNARALIIYALSGGRPALVRAVAGDASLPDHYGRLLSGALAYLEGRADDARRHFDAVGATRLDASIRGSVLLAKAALQVESDADAALSTLHRARTAAPGTLVEEAALRRAILIAAEEDRIGVLEPLANRYLRKFRHSVYAGNFRKRLAAAITRMSFIETPADFARLERILRPMTDAGRQEIYLLLARAAIENGDRLAAAIAAAKVQEIAAEGTLDHLRARLYEAAARVVDPEEFPDALRTLRTLRTEDLPAEDRAIRSAALRLSTTVTKLPGAARFAALEAHAAREGSEAPEPDRAATGRAPDVDDEAEPTSTPFDIAAGVEGRVEAALAKVDELLKDMK